MSRPVGFNVDNWVPPPAPSGAVLKGRYALLEPLDAESHVGDLYRANVADDAIWDYLPYGPFRAQSAYHKWVREMSAQDDPYFYAIKNLETGRFEGVASYLRIAPAFGC